MISVAITDDHPVVAKGLSNMLSKHAQLQVTGIFTTAGALLAAIEDHKIDVLILDMQLPDGNGYDTAKAVLKKLPGTGILVFSSTDVLFQVKKMLQAGCLGYLTKNADDETIVKAIDMVARGERYLSAELENALLDDFLRNKKKSQHRATLTRREKEVLELIVKEFTNQEIADKLFLSISTIEFHRTSLLQKLDVKNTAGLVRVAIESGMV